MEFVFFFPLVSAFSASGPIGLACMSELGINAGSVGVDIEGDGRW